jgi:hypothetical protein
MKLGRGGPEQGVAKTALCHPAMLPLKMTDRLCGVRRVVTALQRRPIVLVW